MVKMMLGAVAAGVCASAFALGPVAVKTAKPETISES